jgi:hypothetical protein
VKWEARQMINKNRWVADNDHRGIFFPTWRGEILRDKNEEEQKKIARKIYALAYEEELYRVIKKGKNGNDPETLLGVTIFDFHSIKKKDGSSDLVNEDGLSWFNDCEQQCKISYYDLDGQIATEWRGSFFGFHKYLRSEKYMDPDTYKHTYDISFPVEFEYDYDDYYGCELYSINLLSDIWFPRVVGWLDSEEPFYDNSELAALNAPRLNRFLQRTKKLILSLGGEWNLAKQEPKVVDEYDKESWYYYIELELIDLEIANINGVQKEVYPSLRKYWGVEYIPSECQVLEDGISLELDLKPRNYWYVSQYDSAWHLPTWRAKFPVGKIATQQDAWPLIKTILEVGWQEEILRIFTEEVELRQFIYDVDRGVIPVPFSEALHNGFFDAIEQLVTSNLSECIVDINGMTKVSYYEKNGQLVDKYVGGRDLGKFLYNYHLGSFGSYQSRFKKRFLYPYSSCLSFKDHFMPVNNPEGCYLDITLTSDIWFPIVNGFMEKKVGIWDTFGADEVADYKGRFDNRELANRHTPRLNRFLSAIAAKVTEMGGEWSIIEYEDSEYREQMTQQMTLTGIKLDV